MAAATGGVELRDGKDPDGPVLHFGREEFRGFLEAAKAGEYDGLCDE